MADTPGEPIKTRHDYRESSIAVVSLSDGRTKVLLDRVGMFPRFVTGGYLVYISAGTLFGVRFDPDRLEVTGSPVPLLEHVSYRPTGGSVHDMGRMDDIYNSRFGETMAVQGRSFSEEEIRRIVLLLSETEMTISEIAARMRCSCSGVAAINRKWKVRAYNGP